MYVSLELLLPLRFGLFRSINTDKTLPYATKYSIVQTFHNLQLFFIGIPSFFQKNFTECFLLYK